MARPFFGQSQAWLETELAKAQADKAAGSALSGGGTGETNFTRQVQHDPDKRIYAILRELYHLDPIAYPAAASLLTTRTRVSVA